MATPGMLALQSKKAMREVSLYGKILSARTFAELATSSEPGSMEKIEVMRSRVARGFSAFHPDDFNFLRHVTYIELVNS